MPAAFDVRVDLGGSDDTPTGQGTTVTNLRFNAEDTNDQDTASPIVIPASGTEFSYWKHLFLRCTTAPDTEVNNVRIHTDGTLGWTGCVVRVGDGTQTKNSGSSAGYDVATAQTDITNHIDITTDTSLFVYTSGSPRTVSISEAGSIINATTETTDYVVMNLEVDNTASPGVQAPAETITWLYDEI